MLRTRTDLWRIAFLGSLGLTTACSGQAITDAVPDGEANSEGSDSPDGFRQTRNQEPDVSVPPELATRICVGGVPELAGNVPTGLVRCDNGVVHRPSPVECPFNVATSTASDAAEVGDTAGPNDQPAGDMCAGEPYCQEHSECTSHAECAHLPLGYCGPVGGQVYALECKSGCATDDDCGEGSVCVCGEIAGHCIDATCNSASDCGADFLCATWRELGGYGCGEPRQLACQSTGDECATDDDCSNGYCGVTAQGRSCQEIPNIACGRPFVVQGAARVAPVVERSDFLDSPRAHDVAARDDLSIALNEAQRGVLADAWQQIGQMEHASIAAFARFSLQLLELGAPCALLTQCQQAMADETAHAQAAFSLASRYARRPLGPGKLPMQHALDRTDLESVVRLVVEEGCIGETVAALEASEAAAHCQDPSVHSVLTQIARDELAHAGLAWRFVAWALGQEPRLRQAVVQELARAWQTHNSAATPDETASLANGALRSDAPAPAVFNPLPHGVLTDSLRHEVRTAALRDIIRPAAKHLLATSAPIKAQDCALVSASV